MKHTLSVLRTGLIVLGCAAGMHGAAARTLAQTSPQPPTFEIDVELVVVDAVVLDRRGDPVAGLEKSDFTLLEDGEPQQIESFDAFVAPQATDDDSFRAHQHVSSNLRPVERPGRSFVVVFDTAHLSLPETERIKPAVRGFLEKSVAAGDRVTITQTHDGGSWTATVPEGRADLMAYIDHMRGTRFPDHSAARISDYEALRIHLYRDEQILAAVRQRYFDLGVSAGVPFPKALIRVKAAQVYTEARYRIRNTLRTLEDLLHSLGLQDGRKAVLLVSEGFVYEGSFSGFRQVKEAARRANAAISFLDARGLQGGPWTHAAEFRAGVNVKVGEVANILSRAANNALGAESVALDSGGRVFKNSNNIGKGLARIAHEAGTYYLLGYRSTNERRDGRFRKVRVKVALPSVKVRARKGYFAPVGDKQHEHDEGIRSQRALDSPFDFRALPVRLASYVFGNGDDGRTEVVLVAEVDTAALQPQMLGDRRFARLESFSLVSSRETGQALRQDRPVEINLPAAGGQEGRPAWARLLRRFQLASGTYQARFVLHEPSSGKTGSLRHRFEVPPAGVFRASTPIFTDTFQPSSADKDAGHKPVPLARRRFSSTIPMAVFFELYNAGRDAAGAPRVEISSRVIDRDDGHTVAGLGSVPVEPDATGRLGQLFMVSLDGILPGGYELRLEVNDRVGGRRIELSEPFQVGTPGLDDDEIDPSVERAGQQGPADYRALVQMYRAGEQERALDTFADWSATALRTAVTSLQQEDVENTCDDACLRAAALLHTEYALQGPGVTSPARASQLETARDLLEAAERRAGDHSIFRKRWFLAVGTYWQTRGRPQRALRYFEKIQRAYSDDPEILLALGSSRETLLATHPTVLGGPREAHPAWSPHLSSFARGAQQNLHVKRIEGLYRKALEGDPTLAEAHLRLGRSLLLRGRLKDAAAHLEPLVDDGGDKTVRFLAHLFLGGLEDARERPVRALEFYRAAVRTAPRSQAATIAFSRALLRAGRAQESRDVLEGWLDTVAGDDPGQIDPWQSFRLGTLPGTLLERSLERLREDVRQ